VDAFGEEHAVVLRAIVDRTDRLEESDGARFTEWDVIDWTEDAFDSLATTTDRESEDLVRDLVSDLVRWEMLRGARGLYYVTSFGEDALERWDGG